MENKDFACDVGDISLGRSSWLSPITFEKALDPTAWIGREEQSGFSDEAGTFIHAATRCFLLPLPEFAFSTPATIASLYLQNDTVSQSSYEHVT